MLAVRRSGPRWRRMPSDELPRDVRYIDRRSQSLERASRVAARSRRGSITSEPVEVGSVPLGAPMWRATWLEVLPRVLLVSLSSAVVLSGSHRRRPRGPPVAGESTCRVPVLYAAPNSCPPAKRPVTARVSAATSTAGTVRSAFRGLTGWRCLRGTRGPVRSAVSPWIMPLTTCRIGTRRSITLCRGPRVAGMRSTICGLRIVGATLSAGISPSTPTPIYKPSRGVNHA